MLYGQLLDFLMKLLIVTGLNCESVPEALGYLWSEMP